MRVLWLTSWYPNRYNTMNGNFVQRHAIAASLYCTVDVIHAEPVFAEPEKDVERTIELHKNFSQRIVYVFCKNSIQRYFLFFRYLQILQRAAEEYCIEKGKPDLVHVNVPYKAGLIAVYLKRRYQIPFVVTEHFGIYRQGKGSFQQRPFFFRFITKLIFKSATHLISPSAFSARGINRMVTKIPYSIIRNTVLTNIFHISKHPRKSANFRFLHISTLNENKNPKGIIRAYDRVYAQNKNTELVIAGELNEELIVYAKQFACFENIQFKAELSYHQVALEMQCADVFVLFSFYENSPCVIGEALCCGLPVIASDTGGISELIRNHNGILVRPGNEDHLCSAMKTMMNDRQKFDPQQIAEEASAAFGLQVIGEQIHNVYKKCLA